MKRATLTIAGCLAFIAIGASFNIEGQWITAVHWLLAGLGLLCLFGILFMKGCEIWEEISADTLDYRTANGFGIESQTRKLQADASRGLPPAHQRPPFKPACNRQTANVTSLDKAYQATLTQARLSGEAAGLLQARGGPKAVNPFKPNSRAHLVWMTSCEAMLEGKAAADAQQAYSSRALI